MHVPREYRVQLGFLGVLTNLAQMAQVSVTVASVRVQTQVPTLVVRGRQEIHDARQMGSASSEQHESACLPLWSVVVRHLVLVSKVAVFGLLDMQVNQAAEVAVWMGKVLMR